MLPALLYGCTISGNTGLPPSRELHITLAGVYTDPNRDFLFIAQAPRPIPIFLDCVTRLDACVLTGWPGMPDPFGAFAQLTHLRIALYAGPQEMVCPTVLRTLEEHADIAALVLSGDKPYEAAFAEWFRGAREADGRLYATGARLTLEDWERRARDGDDIWEDAVRQTDEWLLSRASLHP
ncbi:hypothetical protein PLICRDRAFT_177311 [Plicaturopsis crispa FD-325 SS-3]|nr:hypothetical protein PLICRDRAFT_177311 [Plicaturopsis crispa FD-325 SS-3]